MNRRILINEDERSRILNLHETRKRQEWGLLFEQMAGAAGQVAGGGSQPNPAAQPAAQPAAPKTPATRDEIIAFQEWVVKNKKENIGTLDKLGKGPGVDGIFGAKSQAAWTKHAAEYAKSKEIQTSANDTITYTYYIKDASGNETTKVFGTVDELNKAIAAKQITPDTMVWRKDIGKKIAVKDLKSAAINDAIASIAPEGETAKKPSATFKVSPDGRQPAKDYTEEQLSAAIKDGSLTKNSYVVVTDETTGQSTYQPIMQNLNAAKIVNLALGPEALKQEMPSTGNKTLDDWLKTPSGQTYLSKQDRPSQEAYIDYLEQSGDPIIASVGGKEALRKILLGDVNKDTRFGRWLQRGMNKVRNVGDVLAGKDVVANKGYNPNQPK